MSKHIKQKTAIAWIGYDWKYIFFKANGNIYRIDAKIVEELKLKLNS